MVNVVAKNVNATIVNLNKSRDVSKMNHIDKIANKAGLKLQLDFEKKGFIVPTIVVISALVSIIVNLIKLAKLCKYDNDTALEHIKRPGVVDKIKIRKAIRASLKENKINLPRGKKAEESIQSVEKTINDIASKLTSKDLEIILNEGSEKYGA